MPPTPQQLLIFSDQYEKITSEALVKSAAKKDKKKLDPKAKVRNRGTVCVPASSAKDHKDHFPINNIDQARNALSRVAQYDKVPPWYNGSLKGLQELVSRKVHSKYKGIGKSDKKKKSSLEISDTLLTKYANHPFPPELEYYTLDEVAETLPVSKETYRALWTLMPSDKENPPYEGEHPPEPDHSSRKGRSLKKYWHKLSPEQQQEIISAKAQDEAEMAKYMTPQPAEKNPPIDDNSGYFKADDSTKAVGNKCSEELLNKYAQAPDTQTLQIQTSLSQIKTTLEDIIPKIKASQDPSVFDVALENIKVLVSSTISHGISENQRHNY